jgi:hypothetical protein
MSLLAARTGSWINHTKKRPQINTGKTNKTKYNFATDERMPLINKRYMEGTPLPFQWV